MAAGPAVIGVRRLTHLPDGDEPPMSRRAIPKLSALGIVPKDDPMADTPRSCVFLQCEEHPFRYLQVQQSFEVSLIYRSQKVLQIR